MTAGFSDHLQLATHNCFMAAGVLSWGAGRVWVGVAEFWSAAMTWGGVHVGWAARRSAAAPATSGAEALVPMAST